MSSLPNLDGSHDLRQRAERQTQAAPASPPQNLTLEEVQRTLHELRVHQIELEMQNEELRQAQAKLQTSQTQYFDLYEYAPVGYLTLSKEGLIQKINLTAANLLGMPRNDLYDRPLSRYIPPEDQDLYYLNFQQLLKNNAVQKWETRLLRAAASPCWVQVEATCPQTADGQATICLVLSDISARKQAEAEAEKQAVQTRHLQKTESLTRMAGAIAHHFNNQLSAVMMNLGLAQEIVPSEHHQELVGHLLAALQSTRDAAKVSSLLLTYLGQAPSLPAPLDLTTVCRIHLTIIRIALSRSVSVLGDFPEPGPVVMADENQIQQLLTNLVLNASEALSAEGGVIRVAIRTGAPAAISGGHRLPLNWQPQNIPHACLEVADSGCGIAPHEIEKLGDPFYSTKYAGRGLGLAVVLGIVRTHQGGLTVESRPGHGTILRVYLPMATTALPAQSEPEPSALSIRAGSIVLVVDDEMMVRKACLLALSRFGFIVLAAADGVEALELYRRHADQIQLVLCDFAMPRMNGWETLAALRQLSPGLPVILASGYNDARVLAGTHADLPSAILSKPYDLKELRATVTRVLQAAAMAKVTEKN